MDDTIELFAEAGFIMTDLSNIQTGMGLEVEPAYNLGLANENLLSFMLNSYTEMTFDKIESIYSELTPKILFGLYTRALGYVYFQADLPIVLHDEDVKAFDDVGLDLAVKLFRRRGKKTRYDDGYGFKAKLQTKLNGADEFLYNFYTVPYFASGILYGEVEVNIPIFKNGIVEKGISIIPEIDIDIPNFERLAFWLNLPIDQIGKGNGNNTIVGMGMGVTFKF